MKSLLLSSKNQVVIPKEVRDRLGIKSGQRLYISDIRDKTVTLCTEAEIDRSYGKLNKIWKDDPVEYQRSIRKGRP